MFSKKEAGLGMWASRQQSREPPLAHSSPARFPQLVVLLFLLLGGLFLLRLGLAVPGDDARRRRRLLIAVVLLLLLQRTRQESAECHVAGLAWQPLL